MGKIKAWYRSIPIWLAFLLFAMAGLGSAAVFANRVTGDSYYKMVKIKTGNFETAAEESTTLRVGEGYLPDDMDAPEDTSGSALVDFSLESLEGSSQQYQRFWGSTDSSLSPQAQVVYMKSLANARLVPFLIYAAGLLAAALFFWFTKVRKPLRMLESASAQIAASELGFSLDYAGRDEMARLCAAFERMRGALDENNRRMVRMIDDQHQLNDAYTHDLRTPLAVLRGYTDMLTRYIPTGDMPESEVLDTLRTMSAQVERLERFVGSMSTAQSLADVEIRREPVEAEALAGTLRETAGILTGDGGARVEVVSRLGDGALDVDPAVVNRVFENLLGNALRFAESKVTAELERAGNSLTLRVTDDGPGFTDRELVAAVKPYYTGRGGEEHLGLGLHICRTLCEKHGGSLTLSNAQGGGGSVTAEFGL